MTIPFELASRAELESWLDGVMEEEGRRFLEEVPRAAHLNDDSPLDVGYYVRHRIEAIWRIWLTARVDALALAAMIPVDYEAARQWGRYTADEMDHDKMFLADLAKHNISENDVRRIGPFESTRALIADIERQAEEHGCLPALAYALFVEWNAEGFSARAVEKAANSLSPEHVVGARQHVEFDLHESHLPMIFEITHRMLAMRAGDRAVLHRLILSVAAHFRNYFRELDVAKGSLELAE
jgi:hypothetical protein